MVDYWEIGKRIRAQRKSLGMSQEALAEATDISSVYISQIERAAKHASLTVLMRIAEVLDMSIGQMLIGAESKEDRYLEALMSDCTERERHIIIAVAEAAKRAVRDSWYAD